MAWGEIFVLVVLAAWLTFSATACFGVYFYLRGVNKRYRLGRERQVAVIIPIRGASPHFPKLWDGLRAQTYQAWRLMFVVESDSDPACAAIMRQLEHAPLPRPVEIVVAGPAVKCSQVNHNCLAAVSRLQPQDEFVVFAAADMIPPPDWLAQATHPINTPSIWLASAFALMLPSDGRLSTAAACALCQSLACVPRFPERFSIAWGGTMAVRRHTLESLDLQRWWSDTVSLDSTITRALWEKGGRVFGTRPMLLPSLESLGWLETVRMYRRWYLNARLYLPRLWIASAFGSLVPIAGWLVSVPLAVRGNVIAAVALAIAFGLNQVRATQRQRLRKALSPGHEERVLALADRWGAPAWCVLRAAIVWSVLFMRTAHWAGRVYRVDGPHRIRIVDETA
jgi:cellulose synthase/poly-beta-1,6-N-acetylglucosamine synthase-like glycosyltransferase